MQERLIKYGELAPATFIRRYKRFLVDVEMLGGGVEAVYCPNTGSMLRCSAPGSLVMLSKTPNPSRKTRFTLEMVKTDGVWVGVNTHLANNIAREMIRLGLTEGLLSGTGWEIKREVVVGESRLDFRLTRKKRVCFVEVKNVTLTENDRALFPDAVTLRGQKHLKTLTRLAIRKKEACMLYIVQRSDCSSFAPASAIDPRYADALWDAHRKGVEILAYRFKISPEGVGFLARLPVGFE